MPNQKAHTPEELKKGILTATDTELPDISLAAALDPNVSLVEIEENPDPGDEDPSRDIPAAEVAMTFDGSANGDSADLKPFLERRMQEIADRLAAEEKERKAAQEPPGPDPAA
jgi:hypothetical protein